MKKVLLRAPLLSYSGYGTHARQIFRWLLTRSGIEVHTAILPWGMTPWMLKAEMEGGLIGEIMNRSTPEEDIKYDVSIQLQLPNEWNHTLAKVNVGMSAMVETATCNPDWINCCNRMDRIIVPSSHAKKSLENSGPLFRQVSVVPEAFYETVVSSEVPDLPLNLQTDFNFLVFGQITGHKPSTDRKNIYQSIKWLCETFQDDPDVGIVVKTNSGKNTKIDKKVTMDMCKKLVAEVRQGPYPRLYLLHGAMDETEVAAIYRHPQIEALVSLTRGEGFGLPILEAAASGLPVIATNWSGHLDFMKMGKFIPVDYELIEIPGSRVDNAIFMEGAKWADPVEESFKERVLKFRKKPDLPRQWAAQLKEKITANYSQNAINRCYDEALGDCLE